ncbi:MarR family transcriptional regulator [bacterium]|nr:MarR family transcriptional regulator [bacterium]
MADRQTVFALNTLIMTTRALADDLRDLAAALHADSELSVAERALMLELRRNGPRTVPELARARAISRQATQTTANPLLARGLLERLPNPRHRRSVRLGLTEAGVDLVRRAMRREGDLLAEMARDLEAPELQQATETLALVQQAVRREAPAENAAPSASAVTPPARAREAEA